jgi:cell division protein FtsL
MVDRLLRSQAWIWLIGLALGGIVTMQVSLLKLNAGIGRAVETSSTLERQNAALELSVARLSAGQRIEETAKAKGMVSPLAGSVEYVHVRPGTDTRWALQRMTAPTESARALMANGGVVPGSLAAPVAGTQAPAVPAATTAAPATTRRPPPPRRRRPSRPAPAAQAAPAPQPAPAAQTAQPVQDAAPAAAIAPAVPGAG